MTWPGIAVAGGRVTIDTTLAPIALIYKVNDSLITQSMDGMTDEELQRRPSGQNNPMSWIIGHVVQTRAMLLGLMGDPLDTGWGDLFNRGHTLEDRARYPSREEMERVRAGLTPRFGAKLAAQTAADLAGPPSYEVPGAKTLADQLAFFAFDEAYHVGQLAYIRKALGHSAVAG